MNCDRRKDLREIADKLWSADRRADAEFLESCLGALERCKENEDMYRDNMPENLQESCRHKASETASAYIDSAMDRLEAAKTQRQKGNHDSALKLIRSAIDCIASAVSL